MGKFWKKEPYRRVVETDPKTGDKLHKVVLTRKLPNSFSQLTNEALEGLRSTLDHVGFACAALAGKKNAKSAYFPIADNEAGLNNVIKGGKCKDLPPDILTLFVGFKPYKAGNDPIWAINRACNIAKHRSLVETNMNISQMQIVSGSITNGEIPGLFWDSTKNEIVFGRTRANGDFQYKANFTFFVGFHDIEVIGGFPILAVLDGMLGAVDEILLATIKEAKRVGLT
jgi:hypothetical protein